MGALSELQLSLLALALLFVLAVWSYNKWQEFKQRRAAAQIFNDHRGGDALASDLAARSERQPERGERIEPVIGSDSEEVAAVGAPPLQLADPDIDCLLRLTPREELAAPTFWQAQQQRLDPLADSLRWLAWHQGQWRQLDAHDAGNCSVFVGALQLADRSGPLAATTLGELLAGAGDLAETIGAALELPIAAAVLAQAEALDRFCAGVDWRISLQLVRGDGKAFDAGVLRAALDAGELMEDDGARRAVDATGQTQFVVADLTGAALAEDQPCSGLSLSIDVPLVADATAAFDRLLAFARALIAAQPAQLVDEQRSALGEAALLAIRAKIAEFQDKMAAADVPAGGRRALRLYA